MNQGTLLVIGNQAGDLDSTVCTFCEAVLQSRLHPEMETIALYARPSSQWYLTPEIQAVFHYVRINTEAFQSLSSSEGQQLIRKSSSRFFLVDHNRPEWEISEQDVAGMIDHHQDSSFAPDASPRIVRETGSCASLICRQFRSAGLEMTRTEALLLGAAIIIDTGDFNPEWDKTRDIDREEFRSLQKYISEKDLKFLKSLSAIKQDLSDLSFRDLLIRDYKEIPADSLKAGICSIPVDQKKLFDRNLYSRKDLESFFKEKSLDLLIIMHSRQHPFRRELSLYCPDDPALLNALEAAFPEIKEMDCAPGIRKKDRPGWVFFPGMAPFCSRKKALPLIHGFLNRHELKKT